MQIQFYRYHELLKQLEFVKRCSTMREVRKKAPPPFN